MASIFISYSRKDTDFAQNLVTALEQAQHKVWIDNKPDAIRVTAPWWDEIKAGILQSDVFLLVLSQNSAFSAMCQLEIAEARRHNKKIVTAIIGLFSSLDYPAMIAKLAEEEGKEYVASRLDGRDMLDIVRDNWHFLSNIQGSEFVESNGYAECYQRILTAIDTDLDYANYHSRLQQRAVEWIGAGRRPSLTLRGDNLKSAEEWLSAAELALRAGEGPKSNPPTEEQIGFIRASRQVGNARQRVLISALTVGLIIASVLALVAFWQSQVATTNAVRADNNAATAVRRADESNSLALIANAQMVSGTDRLLALSLAVQANQINNPPPLSQRVLSEFAYTGDSLLGTLDMENFDSNYITTMMVSPDGKLLAVGTGMGTVVIWDTQTHQRKYTLESYKDLVWALTFSPDSHRLLVGGGKMPGGLGQTDTDAGELTLWDMTTGHIIKRLEGHKALVIALGFSADSSLALSSGYDGKVFLWDANTGAQLGDIESPMIPGSNIGSPSSGVMFSADQTQIYRISAVGKPTLFKYDRKSLALIDSVELSVPEACGKVLLHPDGKRFLCAVGTSGLLDMLDLTTGAQLKSYPGIQKTIDSLSFSADGSRLVSSDVGGVVWLWDVETAQELDNFTTTTNAISAAISPDGQRIYSSLGYESVGIWDGELASGAALYHVPLPIERALVAVSIEFSPDENLLFANSPEDGLFLFDASNGSQITHFTPLNKEVSTIAPLPDGKSLLLGFEDGTLARWNKDSAETVWTSSEHKLSINQTRLSKDAHTAITGGQDGQVILWNTETGAVLRRFPAYPYEASAVAITPDGQRAGSVGCIEPTSDSGGCEQHELRVWDVQSGASLLTLVVKSTAMAFSPDGKTVVVTDENNALLLIDIASGKRSQRMVGHDQPVTDIAFSPDGTMILSGSYDSTLILWDLRTFAAIRRYRAAGAVAHLAFSRDGKSAVSSSFPWQNSGKIEVVRWRLDLTSDALLRWTNEQRYIRNLSCTERLEYNVLPVCDANDTSNTAPTSSPYPSATITPTLDMAKTTATLTRTPYPSQTPTATSAPAVTLPLYRVDWSSDGLHLLTTREDGTVQIWDAQSGKIVQLLTGFDADETAPRAKWSPDGSMVVASNAKNNAQVWDIRSGTLVATLTGHTVPITSLAWSKDSTQVLTGSEDGTARVWDARTGKQLLKLAGHSQSLETASWSPDNSSIVTASDDGTALIWDAQTGKELFKLAGHKLPSALVTLNVALKVHNAVWSPDGTRLITLATDGTGIVWDAATGQNIYTLPFNAPDQDPMTMRTPFNAAWSHDGKRLVVFTIPGQPTVWDMQTGKMLFTLEGDTDVVGIGFWSADDNRFLTASLDGTLRVWDMATGKQIQMMDHHTAVWGASLSPDGSRVASSGGDGTLRLWDISTGTELPFMAAHVDLSTTKVVSAYEAEQTQIAKEIANQLATINHNGAAPRTAIIGPNQGQFLPSGEDHWLYSGIAGETITIEVQMQGALTLQLLKLDGSELSKASGSDTVHIESVKLLDNGIYRIELSKGMPTTVYQLTITSVRPATATPATLATPIAS